ncbi:MAG TPA: cupin domain-containing protein [Methanothrix sp.]|nr:cupin domain-containing protein [Methanothrix sp.]
MAETIEEIASRVREMRELSKVTAAEMAEHLQVPLETYTCYEEGKMDIPASKLIEIGQRLDVDMNLLLTGEEPRMRIFTVTREGEGVEVERRKQYRYQNLAGKFLSKKAEFFIVTIEPRKEKPSGYSHPGQEFDYVLEGSLKFSIHDHEIILNEGDSIFFDSSYRHAMEAKNDEPAKMLVVVM